MTELIAIVLNYTEFLLLEEYLTSASENGFNLIT